MDNVTKDQVLDAEAKSHTKDTRHLEDIQADHGHNLREILDKCKVQCFPSKVYAYQYRMHCIEKGFQNLGFSPQKIITQCTTAEVAAEMIDRNLAIRNIRFEDWAAHEDPLLRGAALYKDNELVYFIALVHQSGGQFLVRTNVTFE
jgi:hypothetical protein